MAVQVSIPTILRTYTNGAKRVEASGGTLQDPSDEKLGQRRRGPGDDQPDPEQRGRDDERDARTGQVAPAAAEDRGRQHAERDPLVVFSASWWAARTNQCRARSLDSPPPSVVRQRRRPR